MSFRMRRFLQWFFRNRDTGVITIAQRISRRQSRVGETENLRATVGQVLRKAVWRKGQVAQRLIVVRYLQIPHRKNTGCTGLIGSRRVAGSPPQGTTTRIEVFLVGKDQGLLTLGPKARDGRTG
jgi:hypothetical protein